MADQAHASLQTQSGKSIHTKYIFFLYGIKYTSEALVLFLQNVLGKIVTIFNRVVELKL